MIGIGLLLVRHVSSTIGEDAEMGGKIAIKFKVSLKASVLQHHQGIATDRSDLASLEQVVIIQLEEILLLFHSAQIADCLTIILTSRFQLRQLEQPGCR